MDISPSERLFFREFQPTDVEALFAFHSDPDVVRYIPWPIRTAEQVTEWLTRSHEWTAFEKEGDYLALAIVRQEDLQLIGQINAMYRSEENKRAEIGYVINPQFSGHGYATEAVTALVTDLFTIKQFHRVTAHLDDRNHKSAALLERIGFRREAHFLQDEFFKGEWTSSYEYALLRDEWKK